MKFDVVIGNPPYQMEVKDTRAKQIYPDFMESAYSVGNKVSLVTPGRFLFNAGATPKAWNEKMLNDIHLKIIDYRMESTDYFSNVDIKGGVAITYRDIKKSYEPIGLFIPHKELSSILDKTLEFDATGCFSDVVYTSVSYQLTDIFHNENPKESNTLPKGREMLTTNIFEKFPHIFKEDVDNGEQETHIRIYGRQNRQRVYRWVDKRYIRTVDNFDKWKVFLPKSNGSGAIGEVLSTPMIGTPMIGHTQTFISIGSFDTEQEAESCIKYIKSKFARSLLGVLKVTQDNPPRVWSKVPLQDFTSASDINWSQSVANIDQQLYKKYNLNEEEIKFIEENIKEME